MNMTRTEYYQSVLGEIPKDWKVERLGNIFDFKNGLNKEKKYFGKGTPIVNYVDVYNKRQINGFDLSGRVQVSKLERERFNVLNGDVFFTRTSETIHEIGLALAERMGVKDKFDDGKSEEDYLREFVAVAQEGHADFPSYEEFREKGIYKTEAKKVVAYKDFIEDPIANPLPTPSGKIEIFSKDLYDINHPRIPAVPKYMPAEEGPQSPLREKYPLQLIGHHTKRRVHSTFDNLPWMEEVEPQRLWINPQDAAKRGIKDGDLVKIYNERGTVKVKAKVTPRLIPGVCSLPQGAWYTPDKEGVDIRGCVNTLTTWEPNPLSKGNPQHTNLVEVERA